MDSGWAVVIGAAIALVGSAVVPWVRESVRERQQYARARRTEIATTLGRVGRELSETSRAVVVKGKDSLSILASAWATVLELELLLEKEDSDIGKVARSALQLVYSGNSRGAPAAYAEAVAAWHRDGVKATEALVLFRELLTPEPPAGGVVSEDRAS